MQVPFSQRESIFSQTSSQLVGHPGVADISTRCDDRVHSSILYNFKMSLIMHGWVFSLSVNEIKMITVSN